MGICKVIFFAILCAASGQQFQNLWDILNSTTSRTEIINLSTNIVAGPSHPTLLKLPVTTKFACKDVPGPGYFADIGTQCQVFHRCDANATVTSYLCPNMTAFNPITLVCENLSDVECQTFFEYLDYYTINYGAPLSPGVQVLVGGSGSPSAAPALEPAPGKVTASPSSPAPAGKDPVEPIKVEGKTAIFTKSGPAGQPSSATAQSNASTITRAKEEMVLTKGITTATAAEPTVKPIPEFKAPVLPTGKGKAPAAAVPMTTTRKTTAEMTTEETTEAVFAEPTDQNTTTPAVMWELSW
ncbi:uncharacterized protein LOC129596893 [Paramacrobiotus metropolitanus]|uniref:uncharacterized protein LOC129596893 n=1 Tax=Paramacrobiotus metropolitanus TaxID=2943436 RepID=UPI002445F935|nr:uncharacterized protein LOC129596893 [Paramacrobiotus metropolitanus]